MTSPERETTNSGGTEISVVVLEDFPERVSERLAPDKFKNLLNIIHSKDGKAAIFAAGLGIAAVSIGTYWHLRSKKPSSEGVKKETPKTPSLTDTQRKGFESFFEQNYQRTIGLAYKMGVQNPEDAEDLAAKYFEKMYQNWNNYSGQSEGQLHAVRIKTMKNLVINNWRDNTRNGRYKTFSLEELVEKIGNDALVDPQPSSEDAILCLEQGRLIIQNLGNLVPSQKAAFLLSRGGLQDSEVARVMGITQGAVKALLHRGRVYLRKVKKEYDQT